MRHPASRLQVDGMRSTDPKEVGFRIGNTADPPRPSVGRVKKKRCETRKPVLRLRSCVPEWENFRALEEGYRPFTAFPAVGTLFIGVLQRLGFSTRVSHPPRAGPRGASWWRRRELNPRLSAFIVGCQRLYIWYNKSYTKSQDIFSQTWYESFT